MGAIAHAGTSAPMRQFPPLAACVITRLLITQSADPARNGRSRKQETGRCGQLPLVEHRIARRMNITAWGEVALR